MNLWLINHTCEYEIRHLIGMFFPGQKFTIFTEKNHLNEKGIITEIQEDQNGIHFFLKVELENQKIKKTEFIPIPYEKSKQLLEEVFGRLIYEALSEYTGIYPPWGILTGVRPEKFVQEAEEKGLNEKEIHLEFEKRYFLSKEKIDLLLKTAKGQSRALKNHPPNGIDLYVGIPFCPSRCLYCSFVSHDTAKAGRLIPEYVDKLCEELIYTAGILRKKKIPLHTIYIGGGTPTTLSPNQLEQLLSTISTHFDLSTLLEYTVEAGRSDTITAEKLEVLKKYQVNRVSINPQSMIPSVLEAVGRPHSPEEVVEAFRLAKSVGFPIINMDLIAGLHTDTPEGFSYSLEQILALEPENITIHTLSVKRASDMVEQGKAIYDASSGVIGKMLGKAYPLLETKGYEPYYLYRQKNMRENMENVGFAKLGTENLYNIYMMDELESIVACGAGSVSKLIYPESGKIDRIFNFKNPHEYLRGFDEILARKKKIVEYLEEN